MSEQSHAVRDEMATSKYVVPDNIKEAIRDQARFKWLILQEPAIDVVAEALKEPDVDWTPTVGVGDDQWLYFHVRRYIDRRMDTQ